MSLDLLDRDPITEDTALLCEGLVRRMETLIHLRRQLEALAIAEDILQRYFDTEDPDLREMVGWALLFRAKHRDIHGQRKQGITDLETLIAKFSADQTPAQWVVVHDAYEQYVNVLMAEHDFSSALRISEELLEFLANHQVGDRPAALPGALYQKAWTLHKLGDDRESREICEDVVSRFDAAADPVVGYAVELTDELLNELC